MEGTDIEWLVTMNLQSRSKDEHWYSAYIFLFPFLYLVVDYSLWNGTAHIQGGPSLFRSTSPEMPIVNFTKLTLKANHHSVTPKSQGLGPQQPWKMSSCLSQWHSSALAFIKLGLWHQS